jgi:soluble lytic murein transglycosylase
VLCLAGCERSLADARPQGAPQLARSAAPVATRVAATEAPAPLPEPAVEPNPTASALRREDWQAAAAALDALGPELLEKPELRYARARAALELGEHARAIELVLDLEAKLPSLAERIARLRAEAQLEAGPFDAAAAYFSKARDPRSSLLAGQALRRAGKLAEAQRSLDMSLAATKDKRPKALLEELHAERAALFEQQGDKQRVVTELRWLAIEAPLSDQAEGADERLAKLVPTRALTKKERATRLLTFAEAGEVEAVEREIEKLGATPGPAIGRGRVAYARGYALFAARSDYARAAELLNLAAREGAADPAQASFYAARSLARAHQDDRAIAAYGELVRRYPRTYWAEYGTYLIAKTYYAGGRFAQALAAYDTYRTRYGAKGRYVSDVAFERAVALFGSARHADAARAFADLRVRASEARERARLFELEGAARTFTGERARAVELLRAAVSEQPLSFAALAATTRLEALGEQPPAPLGAPSPGPGAAPLAISLPEPVALLSELGLDREAELELLPRERELGSQFTGRANEALCRAYGRLDVAARRYQIGQGVVASAVLRSAPSPATLWQWECIYPRPHQLVVREASENLGIAQTLLWSIMRQESGFRPDVVSPANAVGLMQLIPPTAERVARELALPYDRDSLRSPAYNVKLGGFYLKKLLDLFNGNFALAAAAYNAGPQAVFRWLEHSSDLPLDVFVARIPYEETQGYVERVLGNQARYGYVEAGEAGIPKLALELPRGLKAPPDLY